MTRIILPFIFTLLSNTGLAQTSIKKIIERNSVKTDVYKRSNVAGEKIINIPCEFGKAELRFPDSVDISKLQVIAVDLVYTDYPSSDDLKKLNSDRLIHLFAKYPHLQTDDRIEWRSIRQMDGAEREKAMDMFHGFMLYCRPRQDMTTMKTDLEKLKTMLSPTPVETNVPRKNVFIAVDTTHLRERYEIEPYTIVKKMTAVEALRYTGLDEKEIFNYRDDNGIPRKIDSVYVYEIPGGDSIKEVTTLKAPEDSTVIKVFDRAHWKKMLVVADVTASMYPYIGQLLYWMKLHEDERDIQQFVFFNDGDNLDDERKKPGTTGGIYSTNSSVFDVVAQTAFKAMSKGSGGAIPENNIEALLAGINACPDCSSVVMIADNASPVSDMILLNQLNRPVHIILCGTHGTINPDYLTIAHATGGSVHLMNEDLGNLSSLREGEKVVLGGREYRLVGGRFVLKK